MLVKNCLMILLGNAMYSCINYRIKNTFILALLLFLNSSALKLLAEQRKGGIHTGGEGRKKAAAMAQNNVKGRKEWGSCPDRSAALHGVSEPRWVRRASIHEGDLEHGVRTRTGWGARVKAHGGWPRKEVAWHGCQSSSMVKSVATNRSSLQNHVRARTGEGDTAWWSAWGWFCAGESEPIGVWGATTHSDRLAQDIRAQAGNRERPFRGVAWHRVKWMQGRCLAWGVSPSRVRSASTWRECLCRDGVGSNLTGKRQKPSQVKGSLCGKGVAKEMKFDYIEANWSRK